MDALDEVDVWHVNSYDRKIFFRPRKSYHHVHDNPLDKINKHRTARECMDTLDAVTQSLQHNYVMITEHIAFHQHMWDMKLYEDDPRFFPVSHVTIKCNVLSTTIETVRKYSGGDSSEESIQEIQGVFKYLRKLLEATESKVSKDVNIPITRKNSNDSVGTKRWSTQFLFSSVRRSNSRSKSRQSISVPSTPPHTPAAPPAIKTTISYSNKATSQSRAKQPHPSKENFKKFQEYKPLIIALYHRLKIINREDTKNMFIFQFVKDSICKFIIDDCKLILIDYIERRVLQENP